ncbi:MAG: hypothetical protein C0478_18845 [Planctomyces sp.]|nr:hypothetical protein [Planctomyces sp.]
MELMLKAELKILVGKHQGKVISLAAKKFLVGREQDCHLRPNSDLVSRHHCVFTIDDYAVRLRDLGSTNGTQVNGENIRGEIILNEGDKVTIGKLELQLQLKVEAAEAVNVGQIAESLRASVAAGSAPSEVTPTATVEFAGFPAFGATDAAAQDTSYEMPAFAPEGVPPFTGDTAIVAGSPPPPPPAMPPVYSDPNAQPMGYPPGYGVPQYGAPQYGAPQYPTPGYPANPYGTPGYPPAGFPAGYPAPGYGQPVYPQPGYPAPGYPGAYAAPQMPAYAPAPVEPAPAAPSAAAIPIRLPNPEETGAVEKPPAPPAPAGGAPSSTEKPSDKAGDIIKKYLNQRGGR